MNSATITPVHTSHFSAEISDILQKLRARVPSGNFAPGGGTISSDGRPGTFWGGEAIMTAKNPDGAVAAETIVEMHMEIRAANARMDRIRNAAAALVADVHSRYPDQELYCPFMRELEAALPED